jgi:tetratricopeptide (TPR) repeat protein
MNTATQNTNTMFKTVLTLSLACLLFTTQYACKNAEGKDEQSLTETDSLAIPPLAERKGALATTAEWQKTKEKVTELTTKITGHPVDESLRLKLATIYMQEARITLNPYYYQATWKILDGVLKLNPQSFEAYVYKASVAMSLHNFAQAKDLAEKAQSIIPDNAYIYGILVDANVELGNYEEAVKMSDKMQALKPSLESYSRASYLREIYGDYPGAIDAMQMAVDAGATGLESAEWARTTLGDLYLATGNLKEAEERYRQTLVVRPEFPNAEIGLAKIEKARKNYDSAIAHTERAIRIISETSYVTQLGELYDLKGDHKKADEVQADVVRLIEEGEEDQKDKVLVKHNGNRELAMAYMHAGNLTKALKYATADYNLRPNNIDANELMASIYYQQGDYARAKIHADKMFVTNIKNPTLLYKASMVYGKAGDATKAAHYATEAKRVNPIMDGSTLLAAK